MTSLEDLNHIVFVFFVGCVRWKKIMGYVFIHRLCVEGNDGQLLNGDIHCEHNLAAVPPTVDLLPHANDHHIQVHRQQKSAKDTLSDLHGLYHPLNPQGHITKLQSEAMFEWHTYKKMKFVIINLSPSKGILMQRIGSRVSTNATLRNNINENNITSLYRTRTYYNSPQPGAADMNQIKLNIANIPGTIWKNTTVDNVIVTIGQWDNHHNQVDKKHSSKEYCN